MITIATIKQTCGACPQQWEGKTTDGKDVYIRERHGSARVDIDGKTLCEMEPCDNWGLEEILANFSSEIVMSNAAWEEYNNGGKMEDGNTAGNIDDQIAWLENIKNR